MALCISGRKVTPFWQYTQGNDAEKLETPSTLQLAGGYMLTAEKSAVSSHFFQLIVIFCHFSVSFGKLFLVYFRLFLFILVLSRPCDCLSLTYFAHFYPSALCKKPPFHRNMLCPKAVSFHEEMSSFYPNYHGLNCFFSKKGANSRIFWGSLLFKQTYYQLNNLN